VKTLAVVGSTGQFGGAEATDIHYVAELVRRGVRVRWATPAEGPLHQRLEAVGVQCDVVESPAALDALSRRYLSRRGTSVRQLLLAGARYEYRLARWLRSVEPDGVLATGFRAQLAATPVTRALRLPLAWVASDFVPTEPAICRVWAQLARRPRLVITYSDAAAAQPALRWSRSTLAVHSGVDLDAFVMGPLERDPLLVLIGHLTPLKNHLGFLDVLKEVRRDHPLATGLLAGADIYRTANHQEYAGKVRAAVAAADGVVLEAPTPEAVPALLRRAALLLHLSSAPETFGRVCAEAMASGAVVVGYRHGATPEVVGDEGALVDADDLDAVAQMCKTLLTDGALRRRFAIGARRRVEERFTVERAGIAGADALTRALGLG
jgi:glycosyltransferase involved in cell wall biosynthesis